MKAVNLNPAMMEFLDTVRNHEEIPNENYARELQELFTLGVKDSSRRADNYTQDDVAQIARAFTGWDYDKVAAFLDDDDTTRRSRILHPGRGPKVIYKTTGRLRRRRA